MSESELHTLQRECDQLIHQHKTLLLASRSNNGKAEISYAPYLRVETIFYIFVSELAKHTQNLLSNPQASILFIESETDAANLFARRRLTFDCQVVEVNKTDPAYSKTLDAMAEKLGKTLDLLRSLPDFHLLAIRPEQGQFIAGFGKAFAVDAKGRLQGRPNNQ